MFLAFLNEPNSQNKVKQEEEEIHKIRLQYWMNLHCNMVYAIFIAGSPLRGFFYLTGKAFYEGNITEAIRKKK